MMSAAALEGLLRSMPTFHPGQVWLAGAGPGDPALLTLYALAGLAQADVVVHDALVDEHTLNLARPEARRVFAGKRSGQPSAHQAEISAQLIKFADAGARVLRLKGGDPYVFGRGAEEVLALAQHGVPFRVIPGITAGLAGLTMALVPATERGVNKAIVLATGHGGIDADGVDSLDWVALARLGQPIVFYMAMARIRDIAGALLAAGLPGNTAAAVVASATLPEQRVLVSSLAQLADEIARRGIGTPAIVVIGETVRMRARLLALLPQLAEECLALRQF